MLSPVFMLAIICMSASSVEPSAEKNNTIKTTTQTSETTGTSTVIPTTTDEPSNVTTLAGCDNNDVNCTSSNTTTEESITKGNGTKTNKTETIKNRQQQVSKYSPDSNICTCNLQAHLCDINCCCDPDCSATDKAVFKYCELDENRFFDDRYCNYIKHIYVNNTPFEWEVNQEGLFCIISSNVPKSHLVQKENAINSFKALSKPKLSLWIQDIEQLMDNKQLQHTNYVFGDPIMTVKNDSSINFLRISKNLLTQPCVFKEDVLFLRDDKSVCSQVNIDEDNEQLSFSSFFQNFKVIGNPKLVNLTKAKGNLYNNCPKNICMQIEPKLCDSYLNNCSKLDNSTNFKFRCSFDIKDNRNICHNAARKIHYKIYHNGTYGLHKVEVLGALHNFSYHFEREDFEFIQDFSMEFLWINQTKNYSQIFSGNPGYIVGKPILTGLNFTDGNQTLIRRNSSNFIDIFLAFPENVQGKCIRNETFNIPLEFGYNMRAKCHIMQQISVSYSVKQNATEMCRDIQRLIFNIWGIPTQANYSLVFGLFGNAMPGIHEDWNTILYRTDPNKFINHTQGIFTNKNATLACFNIATLIDVEVFYSRVDLKTVLNQHKILGITIDFGNSGNNTYFLQKGKHLVSLNISFGLVSQVSFYDITGKRERRFVDPPSFDIRLPYDFFYPFIKIGSGTDLNMPNIVLLVLIFVLNVLFK